MKNRDKKPNILEMFSVFNQTSHTFEGMLPDEHTIMVVRMHWFILASRLFVIVLYGVIPLIGCVVLTTYFENSQQALFIWLIASIYFLWWWYLLFYQITIYILNVWIITDHRIIESEQHALFSRGLAEMNLIKIQDLSVDINGLFETYLNFGDLQVQSASEVNKFQLRNIPNPDLVKDTISKVYNKFLTSHPEGIEKTQP